MRLLCKGTLLICILAIATGPAESQAPAGKLYGLASLVRQKGVQSDLKLTPKQVDDTIKAAQAVADKYKDDLAKLADLKGAERYKKENALGKALTEETNEAIARVLTPMQMTRIKQIHLQQRGPYAFTEPEVVAALKYTKEQTKKIRENDVEYQKAVADAAKITNLDERSKKIVAAVQAAIDKDVALLTPEQKKIWEELIGRPYNK